MLNDAGIDIVTPALKPEIIEEEPEEKGTSQKLMVQLTSNDRSVAVENHIVPKAYKNAQFSEDRVRRNISEQYKKSKKLYRVYNFSSYINICNNILTTIRMKKLPERSYIIGAPNGFGKTSFVNECLITLNAQGYRVVPYISLLELATIRTDNEQRLMKPFAKYKEKPGEYDERRSNYYTEPRVPVGYTKVPEVVTGHFSYSEYINADCLFVSLTDIVSKDIESHTLYQLLSIRGAKGLPTIVMMAQSLDIYLNDAKLKEFVWDEIKTYNKDEYYYDRLYHVSTYKIKSVGLNDETDSIEEETGIVQQ